MNRRPVGSGRAGGAGRRTGARSRWGGRTGAAAVLCVLAPILASCAPDGSTRMPGCGSPRRLAVVAQAVPEAAYVPCVTALPTGWSFEDLDVDDDGATITLESDRADRAVDVTFTGSCEVGEATPVAPSDEGVRTSQLVTSIRPRYAGRLIDVFPGGCVVTDYDFERGPHVALVTELQEAVGLRSRRELRQALRDELDVELDP